MSEEYEVGYKKPPAHSRFQKGRSGNPSGRAKKPKSVASVLSRAAQQKVTVTESGRRRRVTKLEIAITQLVNKAAGGDFRSQKLLLDLLGPATEGEAPITTLEAQARAKSRLEILVRRLSQNEEVEE